MEMINYCVIAGVSILFQLGCLLHLRENNIFSVKIIKKFQILIIVLITQIIVDTVFYLLEGCNVPSLLLYIIKACELTMNPILSFLVFEIFYDKRKSRHDKSATTIRVTIIAVACMNGILQITTVFGGYMFYIDKNNIYHRGPLTFVYVILLFMSIFAMLCGIMVFSSKTQSTMKATLLSFIAILVVSITLRFYWPSSNYDYLGMSVSTLFLLIYYSHVTLRVDPLTKLLNRQVYSKMIKRINYTTIVIVIDVNDFKQINDTYGHECGDQTLKQLARTIYKTYGKYAYCFRVGGDEFCVILKPDAFDKLIEETPYCDVYTMAENFMKKLDDTLLAQVESEDTLLNCGVSQGFGIFYSEADDSNEAEKMPLKEVIKLADRRMYHNKEKNDKALDDLSQGANGEGDNTKTKVIYETVGPTVVDVDTDPKDS